jgi:D-arabinose 1-dehydrogenase-like Zn-dependent alcohol dehydrogenase
MSDTNAQRLPATCRALIFPSAGQPLTVQTIPTPDAVPGSVIVRVLASTVEPATAHILSGEIPSLTVPTPLVLGGKAFGRVAAIGPDTTSLQVGQLVMLEPFVRGRDNPDVQILWGVGVFGANPMAKKLIEGSWRNGMFAEYARAPLENCYALNERILLGSPAEGGLGYSVADLTCLSRQLVAYGGLRGIDLKAGETVIVAPATGAYSGAAVEVASAMGARVIAVGRNLNKLQMIAASNARVNIVQLKGNVEEDLVSLQKFGPIDAYIDISPGAANNSTHVRSCLMALKPYGRASLMGFIQKDIAIPYAMAVLNNLTIRGQYMYEREDARGIIKLAEAGVLKLGKSSGHDVVGQFPLEEWEKAIETAKQNSEAGKMVLFTP